MRIDIAAQTDIGRRKRKNEDYYGVFRDDAPGLQLFRDGALLCVADGLGGHVAGEIASKLAVSVVKDVLKEPAPAPAEGQQEPGVLSLLRQYILRANDNVHKTNQDLVKSGRPMGTTLLAALVTPKKVFIANVGDSRCYLFRDGELTNRTEDHSWVDEQVKAGLMSKAEAESDSRKYILTRSVGTHPQVEIDDYVWDIQPGDFLLLCTDGLVNMVRDAEITAEFKRNASPAEIAHRLITMANDNGGKDNTTVVVADIMPSLRTVMGRRLKAFSKKRGAKLLYTLLLLLFGGLCFLLGVWAVRAGYFAGG